MVYNGKRRSNWNTISQMPFERVNELFSVDNSNSQFVDSIGVIEIT